MNNTLSVTLSLLLVASVGYLARQLPHASLTIRDANPVQTIGGMSTNTIAVDADGKVSLQPDMMILSVSISEIGKTTADAQKLVNTKIDQVKAVLKDNAIADKYIQSTNVQTYPEYNYNNNGTKPEIIGQRATHTLTIKIPGLDKDPAKATAIYDKLVAINGIMVSNNGYDVEDKTAAYTKAREMAFAKAKQKAQELAKLGDLTLGKPLSINESNQSVPVYYPMARNTMVAEAGMAADSSVGIAPGQMDVAITIQVVFAVQ